MSKAWQQVPLGEVVTHRKKFIQISDTESYKRCRVQLHARGIVLRDVISGAEVKTKKQQVCRAGEFLVAEIDAKVGGFGIVPELLDKAIVSSHYFLFSVNEKVLNRRFLNYFIRTPTFREQVSAQGSTNYAAIRPNDVLEYSIPLPPLSEQRRILARIEELAAKIEEARGLRREAAAEVESISSAVAAKVFDNAEWIHKTIEELVGRANLKNGKSLKATSLPSEVSCLTLSALRHGRINCSNTKPIPMTRDEAVPYLVRSRDVFIVRGNGSKDLVGRAGLVERDCEGVIFPDLFIRVPLDEEIMLGSFFVSVWNSKRIRDVIEESAKTTSGIWKVNQGHIAATSIPVPPISEQQRIVSYLNNIQGKVEALKRLQTETADELHALLPSVLDKAFRGEL